MKYNICIEETVTGDFVVEANSKEEALAIAKNRYDNCEFVNEPGDLVEKKIAVRTGNKDFGVFEIF